MYAIVFLQGMVFYGSISTLYRQAYGVSIFQITVIESVSLILTLLLEIPWGIIADRIGYKRTMVLCCLLYLVSQVIFWQATGFSWFLVERIILGIVIAGMSGVDTSILYLSAKEGESQKVFGTYNALQTAGLLVSALVFSLWIGDHYRVAALATVITYACAAVLSFFLVEVKEKGESEASWAEIISTFKIIFKNKSLILFLVAVALLSESHQTITVFLNQLQYKAAGLSSSTIGTIFIVVVLVGLISAYSSKFTRAVGQYKSGYFFFSVAAALCLVLSLQTQAYISVGCILGFRAINALFQPYQMELQNKQVTTKNRATALSVNAMIVDCIGAGTNLVFGSLAERNLSMSFGFGSMICLVGLGLFIVWCMRRKESALV